MSNLLDKASVILTPTAYNNGEALCVKPSDGSGDFQFSRNSAATRVNAQGLVENVQILSSNLVQNGDFSQQGAEEVSNGSFSQEGSEVIVNGNFANGTNNWVQGSTVSDFSVTNEIATIQGAASSFNTRISQSISVTIGKTYKITGQIKSNDTGDYWVRLLDGSYIDVTNNNNTEFQTFTYYHTATSTSIFLYLASFYSNGSADFSIDNVSVREVGQDWVLAGSGWSIGEDKIVSVNGSSYGVYQLNALVSGKTYKITYEVKDYVSGQFGIRANTIGGITALANGVYTDYLTSNGDKVYLMGFGAFNGSVTNISVKEVGQNWNFDANWSIGNNKAISTGVGRMFQSIPFLEANVGTKVKVSFDIVDYTSAGVVINCYGGVSSLFQGVGSYSFITTTTNTLNLYVNNAGAGNLVGSITNLSVIAITSDTNLPRISYENFSYQDALGSEEVVNGSFDTDTAWSKGTGWSIANGTASHTGGASYLSQSILEADTQYKVDISVTEVSGGGFVQIYMGNSPASVLISTIGDYTYYFTSQSIQTLGFALRSLGDVSIDNVSVKEYLGQSVVPNSGCGSWLFEPQSTNLIPNANQYSGNTVYYTVTPNQSSPDGENNATLFVEKTSTSPYSVNSINASIIGGQTYTYSFFVKYAGKQNIPVNATDGVSGYVANIDILNGTVNSGTADVKDFGNGWFRVLMTRTVNASASNGSIQLNFGNQTGDGISGFYLFGYQIENLSFASSYIPTSGSQVTRNQDLCTNGGSLATINSTEGVLYAEIAALRETNNNAQFLSLGSGSYTNNSVYLQLRAAPNQFAVWAYSNNLNQLADVFTVTDITDYNKIAISYKLNDFKVYVNGSVVYTNTTYNPPTANSLNVLEFTRDTSFPFFGKTKALAVWKEALSDSELQSLTTI